MKRTAIALILALPLAAGAAWWGYNYYECHSLSEEVLASYDDIASASEMMALKGRLGIAGDQSTSELEKTAEDVRMRIFYLRLEALADKCPQSYDAVTAEGDERLLEAARNIL